MLIEAKHADPTKLPALEMQEGQGLTSCPGRCFGEVNRVIDVAPYSCATANVSSQPLD